MLNKELEFEGHVGPGTIIFLHGIWWIYAVNRNYLESKRTNTTFRCHVAYKFHFCPNFPLESFGKAVLFLISLIFVAITAKKHALLHELALISFVMEAILEIVRFYYRKGIPPNMTHFAYIVTMIITGVLFYSHASRGSNTEVRLHNLLVLTLIATAISFLCEMFARENIIAALCRPFLFMVAGTWMCQIGAVLSPFSWMPFWDGNDPTEIMMVTIIWGWHILVNFWIVVVIGLVMYLFSERSVKSCNENGHCIGNASTTEPLLKSDVESCTFSV